MIWLVYNIFLIGIIKLNIKKKNVQSLDIILNFLLLQYISLLQIFYTLATTLK